MKLTTKIPIDVCLALSGGADSIFALDFLQRGNRNVHALYFNHGTKFGDECEEFLRYHIKCKLTVGHIQTKPPKNVSIEDFWRKERYSFFSTYSPVITAHHYDDQLETMLMGFCNGRVKKIPAERDQYLRPFLNFTKEQILDYCRRNNLVWLEDPSNKDVKHPRNRIRNNVIPELLKSYPGLYKAAGRL